MAENYTNNQELVDVYMPISREEAKEMGLKSNDIVVRRIGIKNVTCLKTKGTPEFAKKYETMLDTEARAELRKKRCLIPDGKGAFIRCPECNKCQTCEKQLNESFNTNRPLSLEKLTQGDSEEDAILDIEGTYEAENNILARIVLEDILQYLGTFEGKHYDKVFEMLYDRCGTKEIADELGVAWSTAKDTIKKVQKIAQEHTKLTTE